MFERELLASLSRVAYMQRYVHPDEWVALGSEEQPKESRCPDDSGSQH